MTWQEAEESLISCTISILEQPAMLLKSGKVDDDALQFESEAVKGSTAGKHLRHAHDHIRILLDSIEAWQAGQSESSSSTSPTLATGSSLTPLVVDYDMRSTSLLESSSTQALLEFTGVIQRLCDVFEGSNGRLYSQPLRLRATTPAVVDMQSTIGREVWFCGLHAIHHYALARVILERELGLDVDREFGVAPSTLVHRRWKKESDGDARARL